MEKIAEYEKMAQEKKEQEKNNNQLVVFSKRIAELMIVVYGCFYDFTETRRYNNKIQFVFEKNKRVLEAFHNSKLMLRSDKK